MSQSVDIRLLGGLRAFVGGDPVALPASKKTRALLGYLLLESGPHTRSHLCDLLWDGPADPRAALRWSLSKLRPLVDIGEQRLRADRAQVSLSRGGLEVDLFSVEAALRKRELDATALVHLRSRFAGELLDGVDPHDCFAFAHWVSGQRERVRNLRVAVLAKLSTHPDLAPAERVDVAREWVGIDPLDELAHARLVAAHYASGRPAGARAAADACRTLFQRELGRAPGAILARALGAPPQAQASEKLAPSTATQEAFFTRTHPTGLFGRVEDCTAIEEVLAGLEATQFPPVLWFEGEPGIGKSRLLAEALERARARGMGTRFGKAFEAEISRPLALWWDLLGTLPASGASFERPDLFAELLAALESLSRGSPLLLALDDLQWIDEVSAGFLSWLARRRPPWLALVVSARVGEVDDNPSALRLRSGLNQEGLLLPRRVGPLDAVDLAGLVASIRPEAPIPGLRHRTGGNPLFAILLCQSKATEHGHELSGMIASRLARLDERDLELLRVGAAVGSRFSLELAGETTGLPLGELVGIAARLEQVGLLRPVGPDELDFVHDILREAVYAALSEPARRILHKRVARALRERGDETDHGASTLARQAALAGDDELAARAAVAAGREAVRLTANEEALLHARRGAQHAGRLDGSDRRTLLVECLWIEVHAGLGRREPDRLRRRLEEIAEEARTRSEHETAREALYLLSVVDEEAGDFERAQDWSFAAAEAGAQGDAQTRAKALANTGRCLAQLGRRLDEAECFLVQAAEEEEPAPVDLPWGQGLIAWHRGELDRAAERLETAFQAAQTEGSRWAAFECLSRLAIVELARGRPAAVLGRREELEHAATALAGGSELALAHVLAALAELMDRGGDDAEPPCESFGRALDELRAQDSKALLSTLLNQAAEFARSRGWDERAEHWAREALENARAVGRDRQIARAEALLHDM